ncbi:uncharacterized protein LOC143248404 [Tachypleus tridentatus]|uniref:uncharacterized protein LOC143248404 n=1 Tax=Tachypleus tridentatus TaxID=6853 RepID=UPI003FD28291
MSSVKFLVCFVLIACNRGRSTNHSHVEFQHKYIRAWDTFKFDKFVQLPVTETSECCPSLTETIQPVGGVSKAGRILELYQTKNAKQKFFQTSCLEEVRGRPCRFLSSHLIHRSHCVQKYSFTYALVREYGTDVSWRLDYIKIRSGCICEIMSIAMII